MDQSFSVLLDRSKNYRGIVSQLGTGTIELYPTSPDRLENELAVVSQLWTHIAERTRTTRPLPLLDHSENNLAGVPFAWTPAPCVALGYVLIAATTICGSSCSSGLALTVTLRVVFADGSENDLAIGSHSLA